MDIERGLAQVSPFFGSSLFLHKSAFTTVFLYIQLLIISLCMFKKNILSIFVFRDNNRT